MLMGVPMLPIVGVGMVLFIIGMWTLIFFGLIGLVIILGILPACIWWMREVTKEDDARLEQLIQRFSLRIRQINRSLWGKEVAAYSPTPCRKTWR